MICSIMFFLRAASASCFGGSLTRLQLVNTSFNEGREIGVGLDSGSGSLVQLASTCALFSNLSVISRLHHAACLVGCVDCAFRLSHSTLEGLANRFGQFLNGRVAMESVSFDKCIRPVTMTSFTCPQTGQSAQISQRQTATTSFEVRGCSFRKCQGDRNQPGGGAWIGGGSIYLDDISFHECYGSNGWGMGLYAKVSEIKYLRKIEAYDMTAKHTVIHLEHISRGHFETVTLDGSNDWIDPRHNKFERIKISADTNVPLDQIQGGGCGLAIQYAKHVILKWVDVVDCGFQNENSDQKKRAGCIVLEGEQFSKVTLEQCTFTTSPAKGRGTGCIYVEKSVELVISTCKVDRCGGASADHPYSIYVNANKATITGLSMLSMSGGMARIHLGTITNGPVKFTNCVFNDWKTQRLFDFNGTLSLALNLDNCQFTIVHTNGTNLLTVTRGGLTVNNCRWSDGSNEWAIVRGNEAGSVSITGGSSFINMNAFKEPILFFDGSISSVTLDNVRISGIFTSKCFLSVSSGTTTVSGVTFSVNKAGNVLNDVWSSLIIISGGTLSQFRGCKFTSCTWAEQALVKITVQLPGEGILGCQFRDCESGYAAFIEVNAPLKLAPFNGENCIFAGAAKGGMIKVGASSGVPISMSGVDFDRVQTSGSDLVRVYKAPTDVTLNNVKIKGDSRFRSFMENNPPTGRVSVTGGTFYGNTDTLLTVNGQSCEFEDCAFSNGSKMVAVEKGTLRLTGCDFNNAGGNGPVVHLESGVSSLTVSDCCFQSAQSGTTYYIQGPSNVQLTAQRPLCFDRAQDSAVNFGGARPFQELASEYRIFECTDCDDQPPVNPPTQTFTASDTFYIPTPTPTKEYQPTPTPTEEYQPTPTPTEEEEVPSSVTVPIPPEPPIDDDGAKKTGKKAGEIVGILFGILLLIAVILLIIWFVLRRRKEKSDQPSDREMAEETVEETESTWSTMDSEIADAPTETNPLFARELSGDEFQFEERVWL